MMAEPSPPSEQTSILDLYHIAAAISPDLASDFARLADFPVPVPELAPVVEPLKRIEAWSREQTSHSCRNLLHDALKLVVLISERSQDGPTDSSELSPAIEQTVASILDINDHIDIWVHIPRRMSSRWQPTIEATISEHEGHLKNFLDHLSGEVTLPEYDSVVTSEWKVKEGPGDHWVPSSDMKEPVHGDSQPGLSGVVEKSLTSEVPETPDDQHPVLGHSPNPTSQGRENVIPRIDEGSSNVSDMEKWAKFVTVVPGQCGRFKMKTGSSPIYGGFSDVWECDAKFSDGMTIAVGVVASKQLSVSHCLYLPQHRDLGIKQVAVKKFRAVRIDRNIDENTVNGKLLKRLTKELEIWMSLKHPNITPLLGFVLLGDLCIISPWYSNGNVASYINRHPKTDRIKLVSDVACGLAYLHNRALPVIHGDMKPDNVLINETGDAVIIDFGLSSVIEDEPTLATSFTSASLQDAGNARWMAPELLMEAGCTRSLSTDIYSFGCVALFIYTGEIPFKGIPYIQIIYALIQGQKPVANRDDYPAVSSANAEWFYGLLVSCWDTDPRSRPSMVIVEERMTSGSPFQLAATLEIQPDSAEVAIASRRARVLWSERDAATIDATTKRTAPRSRSNSVDSSYATTVVATGRREPNLDHHVKCNGCHTNIVGRRFQCANCPSFPVSYNLCAECEKSSFAIHPVPHVFLKFNRKVDYPVQTPQPLLPVIYNIPADGDFIGSIGNLANYRAVHEITFCDLCMTPIRGVWYRCGHCNMDLCDFHEQTHDEDHSFIMIKAQASLPVLAELWDFDEPSNNAPLLQPVFAPRQ